MEWTAEKFQSLRGFGGCVMLDPVLRGLAMRYVSIPERVWGVCDAAGHYHATGSRTVSIPERVWGVCDASG